MKFVLLPCGVEKRNQNVQPKEFLTRPSNCLILCSLTFTGHAWIWGTRYRVKIRTPQFLQSPACVGLLASNLVEQKCKASLTPFHQLVF
jgi:hypothetical protein